MSAMQDYVTPEERNFFNIQQLNINPMRRAFIIDELDEINAKIKELSDKKRKLERLVYMGDRYGRR